MEIPENIRDFIIELKNFARGKGRSSIFPRDIDQLFIIHNINVKEIEREKDEKEKNLNNQET